MSNFPSKWEPKWKGEYLRGNISSIHYVGKSMVVNFDKCKGNYSNGDPLDPPWNTELCFWANHRIYQKWASQLEVGQRVRLTYEGQGDHLPLYTVDVLREHLLEGDEKPTKEWKFLHGNFQSMRWLEHYQIRGLVDHIQLGKFTCVRIRAIELDRKEPDRDLLFSVDWSLAGFKRHAVEVGDLVEISKNITPGQALGFTVDRTPGQWL